MSSDYWRNGRIESSTRSSTGDDPSVNAQAEVDRLADLMCGRRGMVLSGAGVSTESGIPDYRGPSSRRRKGRPILYREFVGDPNARARYWARSMVGWPRMSSVEPNAGHIALASLEEHGIIAGIVTQNVDGLHGAAGSRSVLELHGSLSTVRCTDCGRYEPRSELQGRLLHLNPTFSRLAAAIAPDGDAELPAEMTRSFRVPSCLRCSGVLRPDIVFFGENVPARRVEEAFRRVQAADYLLVVGSSLAVYSGYRFVKDAVKRGSPVAIVNLGPTRGDELATVRIEAATGSTLRLLTRILLS